MNTANTSKKNSFAPQWEASNHETNAYSFFFSPLYRKRQTPVAPWVGVHNVKGVGSKRSHSERTRVTITPHQEKRDTYTPGWGWGHPSTDMGARSLCGSPSEGTVLGAGTEGTL